MSILIPLILAITFGIQNKNMKKELDRLGALTVPAITGDAENNSPDSSQESSSQDDKPQSSQPNTQSEPVAYKELYPELTATPQNKVSNPEGNKVVYLTFDDGPSVFTPQILDILDRYQIKATFFVVKHDDPKIVPYYKEIIDRGHTLAIHSASHDYDKIYASVEAYLADFKEIYDYIYELTGYKCDLFRFPGGSSNSRNQIVSKDIAAEMTRRGFTYHDWNVDSTDATAGKPSAASIQEKTIQATLQKSKAVVLCHDTDKKQNTVTALPNIIQSLLDQGYQFDKLDGTVKPYDYITN